MLDVKNMNFWLFDMDGTLYLGDILFDFTIPLLEYLKAAGKKYLFMTNNSSKSVADYVKKLARLGIPAVEDDFITSAQATAYYLEKHHKNDYIYVEGTNSLKDALKRHHFNITDQYSEDVTCVVSGFDTELTFQKLEDLSKLLLNQDIAYIATNPDLVCPTEYGYVPDCGSVSEMIYNATGRRPKFIGKPSPLMPQLAMEKWGYRKEETIVVGDRIYTDIKSGINAGINTALVLSGETTKQVLDESPDKPTAVYKDCGEILQLLKT
ncbi:MAG: HAD-IIA family hydrolase [Clostridia bacterium]|nr:HAD-IIA family hydrolase [Clostridia bacterium]